MKEMHEMNKTISSALKKKKRQGVITYYAIAIVCYWGGIGYLIIPIDT